MSFALVYWIVMLLWFIFGLWSNWPIAGGNSKVVGGNVIMFILLFLIGYKLFGPPIHS